MPLELNIEPRTRIGSRESRRMRREGKVPGVLYGRGGEVSVSISEHHFMTVIGYNPSPGIVKLNMPGDKPVNSIIKEVQWNPVTDRPVHIDFLRVLPSQLVTVPVPVNLEGTPKGALHGGILDQDMHELNITVKASDIPPSISVDVSDLEIGDSIHLSQILLPEGMTVDAAGDLVIASVIAPRLIKTETEEEPAGEAETAEAAEGE